MPMCPELLIALLACIKIGAVHSVIYSGLSVGAFVERINDAKAKVLFTADGTYRRGKIIDLKPIADEAILQCPTVETIIVVNHTGTPIEISELSGREIFYDRLLDGEPSYCEPEQMDAEDPLFLLYTSGSTGNPKESCTPLQVTWWVRLPPSEMYLTFTVMISGGVLVT